MLCPITHGTKKSKKIALSKQVLIPHRRYIFGRRVRITEVLDKAAFTGKICCWENVAHSDTIPTAVAAAAAAVLLRRRCLHYSPEAKSSMHWFFVAAAAAAAARRL